MNKVYASTYERACDQQHTISVLLEAVKAAELFIHDEIHAERFTDGGAEAFELRRKLLNAIAEAAE
jgi:hypothetical protein